jgi:uncharacterized protein YneF (UPF0154 family)
MIKARTKSLFIILVTLIVGIAIGFEVSEILIKKRFEEFRKVRDPKVFVNMFEELIKPDKKQKAAVDSILLKHHERISEIMAANRQLMERQIDSLKITLKPYLTNDQMQHFNNEIMRMRKGPHFRTGGTKPAGEK